MIRSIPEICAKRAINYLLRRFFGQYLETFTHEELSLSFNKGTGLVENVSLKVEALNTLCKEYNLPFEFIRGSIDTILVEIPWSALFTENTIIDFKGINLVIQPKKCPEDISMISSMWESMTSSLQLAEDCLLQKVDNDPEIEASQPTESVEIMTKAFNTILSKMKLKFSSAVIRIESVLESSNIGVALEVHIKSAEIFDEGGMDAMSGRDEGVSQPSAYCIKTCKINGIELFTSQFVATPDPSPVHMFSSSLPAHAVAGSPEMPPVHLSLPIQKTASTDIQTEPILISRISGLQQIHLSLKQNDSAVGPKVDISVNLGLVNLFITPFQVHLLIELAQGLAKPGVPEHNDLMRYTKMNSNRPMRSEDFALVEQELLRQRQKLNIPTKSLQNCTGWSSRSLDESEEDFFEIPGDVTNTIPDCQIEDMESSFGSSVESDRHIISGSPASESGKKSKVKKSSYQNLLLDASVELTQIQLSCSSLVVFVLHEDIDESLSQDNELVNCKTSKNFAFLKSRAEKFFSDFTILAAEGLNFKQFASVRDRLSSLCASNHLRFLVSGVTLEGVEKISSMQQLFNATLSMVDLEVLECVYNVSSNDNRPVPTYTELVSFHLKDSQCNQKSPVDTCLKLKYDRFDGKIRRTGKLPPLNKLVVELAPVAFEVDISLSDRIHSLLNPSTNHPDFGINKKEKPFIPFEIFTLDHDGSCGVESLKTEVQINSSLAVLHLKFPIPDLRPLHDMERVPWWKQNLRNETLIAELNDVSLSFVLESEQQEHKFALQCRDAHGLFQMSPNEDPISFIRVSVDPEVEKVTEDDGFDYPILEVKQTLPTASELLNDHYIPCDMFATLNDEPKSITDILMVNMNGREPSPFCSNSLFCGTKLKSVGEVSNENDDVTDDDDQIIRPADKDKIDEFIDKTVNKSQYIFTFTLPTVNIVLPNRKFLEIIVNRLLNDLSLWESSFITISSKLGAFKTLVPYVDLNPIKTFDTFKTCCPDSNSGSEDEEERSCYYSFNEHNLKQKQKQKKIVENKALTKIAFLMMIEKGSLLIQVPSEETADSSNDLHERCGKLQMFVGECKFFVASSYKGDPNEAYVCLQSNRASLYHNGYSVPSVGGQIIQPFTQSPFPNTNLIIYQSESGVTPNQGLKVGCGPDSLDVLSLVVHSVNDLSQKIKTFKVALGFCGTTLRHYMCLSSQTFITQFTSFMGFDEELIKGYEPSTSVVEFHLHLSNCAVDYRPLYLPLKSVLTVENFSLSTNITSSTSSSLLRVISEELRLFLSNDMDVQSVDLKKGYVCVIDTGLIDLSVRVSEVEGKTKPKFEMCASNNMIHIRTCADSCQALQKLIVYLANEGDFVVQKSILKKEGPVKETKPESPKNCASNMEYSTLTLANVQNMMVEAMKECSPPQSFSAKTGTDTDDSDEGFCILEDDLGIGLLLPENKEPQIRLFATEPIRIVDNHFAVPSGKSNLLKAPKHFPKAILSHTLREMSLTWHLYGGNDFKIKTPERKRVSIVTKDLKDGNFSEMRTYDELGEVKILSDRISFCKVTPLTKEFNINAIHYSMENFTNKKGDTDVGGWIAQGGENRNHKVLIELQMNKVSFQHEEYPEDGEYASRDVLMIHDIEIRDKLTTSMINKFLYQYSSESMPRQTHANMIVLKAVHVRPDPKHDTQECSLKVSCKPLRLHIDQDTLMFLYEFFKEFAQETTTETPSSSPVVETKSPASSPVNMKTMADYISTPTTPTSPKNKMDSNLTFFRSFSFAPDVFIKVDYSGKRVAMEQGALQGILLGLGQLNGSEITLKRLLYRHGLLGVEKLLSYAINEWLSDIKNNQLPSILKGVGPVNSVVQLFVGLKDLVWLPVEQYRKDGQIVRGLQRGASSFSTSTATACLELSTLLIGAIQGAAEVAYDMVSPGPSCANRLQFNLNGGRHMSQPADMMEGVTAAYSVVKEGIGDTARNIVHVAISEHERKGFQGAVGGVLRQIPPATIKPLIVGAEAACIVLDGVKHQLVPDAHKEAMDKWRTKYT